MRSPGEERGQWGQHVHWPCGGGHVGELEEPCGCSPASTGEFCTGDRIGKTEMKLPVHRQGPLELGWPSCWDQTAFRKSRESIKKDWNFPSCNTLECSRVSNYLNMSFNQASFLAVDVIYGGLFNWALVFLTELYYLSSPQVWPATGRGDLWFPTWKPLRIVIVKNRGLGPNLSYWIIILFFPTGFTSYSVAGLTTSQKVHTLGQGQWKVTQHQQKFRAGPVFSASCRRFQQARKCILHMYFSVRKNPNKPAGQPNK